MKSLEQLYAFLLTSKVRNRVMKILYKKSPLRQTQIAKKINQKQQNISLVLRKLIDEKLVECLTPEKKAWKVYSITKLGREVMRYLNKNKIS